MNYKFHLPFIILLLTLQFFTVDIFSYCFLSTVEKRLAEKRTGTLYKNHEYQGVSSESPKEYDLAYVERFSSNIIETYYSKNGTKTSVTYDSGKWRSTNIEFMASKAYMLLPMIGFVMIGVAQLSNMIRTGNIWSWQKTTHNTFEKILLIYGIPVFVASIVFGWFGKGQ
jgi:hypothetical protein